MSYFDKYSERVRSQGTLTAASGQDRLVKSLKRDWEQSISAVRVVVRDPNGNLKNVRIQTSRKTVGMDKIYVHPDDHLHSGDIIQSLQDFSWLVLDTKLIGQVYKQANMVRINRVIKWVENGIMYEQPVRVKNFSRVDGVDDYYFFTMPENTINVFLPLSEKTQTIKRDERFMIDGLPYRVTRLDAFSYTGVLVLYIVEDIKNPGDDHDIADYHEVSTVTMPDGIHIVGEAEIPYGFDFIYKLQTGEDVLSPNWIVPATDWYTVNETNGELHLKINRSTEHIGKAIVMTAEYAGETYIKSVLVRSLV